MVKIGFPREFDQIRKLFPEKEKEKDLYIVAENTVNNDLLGAIRFFYHDDQVDIYEMIMGFEGDQAMAVFDGIVRTLLYKMAEEECTRLIVHNASGEMAEYFRNHGFEDSSDMLIHNSFPGEFFKPCAGCSGE
jgi:hypothetical protein